MKYIKKIFFSLFFFSFIWGTCHSYANGDPLIIDSIKNGEGIGNDLYRYIVQSENSYLTVRPSNCIAFNKEKQDVTIVDPLYAQVVYSTTKPTKNPVTVTIITTEPIETPDGWTQIEDTIFIKQYDKNMTEQILLHSLNGSEVAVTIQISNLPSLANFLIVVFSIITFIFLISLLFIIFYLHNNCYF